MAEFSFGAYSNQPLSASYASLGFKNYRPILSFDGSTSEIATFSAIMPQFYSGCGLSVITHTTFSADTTGSALLQLSFERVGNEVLNIDADNWGPNSSMVIDVPPTAGCVVKSMINIADGASMANIIGGEKFRLRVLRDCNNVVDTATQDLQLHTILISDLGAPASTATSALLYRKTITVASQNVIGGVLTDFPVLFSASADSDFATRCTTYGQDIYITDASINKIAHEKVKFVKSTGQTQLWFRAPILTPSANNIFYLYYGGGVTDPASGSVWDTNYQGVYHMNYPVDSYAFAQNGEANPLIEPIVNPAAFYYNGNTYLAWQGDNGSDPYIIKYTHSTSTYSAPSKLGVNPLSGDNHGAPAIIYDSSGSIHAFWGAHNSVMKHTRSTNAEDITSWQTASNIGTEATYPNLIRAANGTIHLIYRDRTGATNRIVREQGPSFGSPSTIIQMAGATSRPYLGNLAYDSANSRIHMAWSFHDGSTNYINIAHAYLSLTDGNMYLMDGTSLTTPVTQGVATTSCVLLNSGTSQTWIPSVQLDSSLYPHLIFPHETGFGGCSYIHARWNGSAWATVPITTYDGNYDTIGNFYFNGSVIEAYLTMASAGAGRWGDIEHWRWTSTSAWAKQRKIFDRTSPYPHYSGLGDPCVVLDGTNAMKVMFADFDFLNYSTENLEVFAIDGNDVFVGRSLSQVMGTQQDSSTYNRDATGTTFTAASGKIVGSQSFDGAADRDDPNVNPGAVGWMLEGWINADSFPTGGGDIYSQGRSTTDTPMVRTMVRNRDIAADGLGAINRLGVYQRSDSSVQRANYGQSSLSANTWYHTAWKYGAASAAEIWINGVKETLTLEFSGTPGATTLNTDQFGALVRTSVSNYYPGDMDEVRLSNIIRSDAWIQTSYANQNSPETFIQLSQEESI